MVSRSFCLSFCAVFATSIAITAPLSAAGPGDLVRQLNEAYINVFDKVSPSVVVIEIEKPVTTGSQSPADILGMNQAPDADGDSAPAQPELSEGSGMICRPDGYIFTNSHVVDATAKMTVKLKDGRSFPAKLVGSDPMSEVAVIKIEAKDLPVVEFIDSDAVRVGQIACVIGAPYNFTYSFTTGVISGKGRNQNLLDWRWSGLFEDFLQTDASINPGNSGGPLLDIDGKVIGMNTLIQGINKGLGFAISSNLLRRVGDELIAHGKIARPWLGLGIQSVQEISKSSKKYQALKDGVIVMSLSNDGPALQSELRPQDVILKVDDTPVKETIDLQREVQKKKVGQTVKLAVWRDGKELTIPVRTAEMPSNLTAKNEPDEETTPADPDMDDSKPEMDSPEARHSDATPGVGLEVQVLTPELAEARKLKAKVGLIVTEVAPDSEAAVAGVRVGDVITEVNSQIVSDEKSYAAALSKGDKSKGTLLFVERDKSSAFLVLKPAE
ncbi:MAG: trypsin-like peptidase domain-containing protein [Chthoniobacterales bacterium]